MNENKTEHEILVQQFIIHQILQSHVCMLQAKQQTGMFGRGKVGKFGKIQKTKISKFTYNYITLVAEFANF